MPITFKPETHILNLIPFNLQEIGIEQFLIEKIPNIILFIPLGFFLPADTDDEGLYDKLNNSNIPIYWNIEESDTDVFAIEVAVGKYVIQLGDTLSRIALRYDTSVEKLLEDNKNIEKKLTYACEQLTAMNFEKKQSEKSCKFCAFKQICNSLTV